MFDEIGEIVVEVATRTENPEMVNRLHVVLGMVENMLNRLIRSDIMLKTVNLTTSPTGSVPLPTDFLEIQHVYSGDDRRLTLGKPDTVDGLEGFYLEGGSLYAPSQPDTLLKMTYYAKLPSLQTLKTNRLLQEEPQIYLIALCRESYLMKGDLDKTASYSAELNKLLMEYKVRNFRHRFSNRHINYKVKS